MAGFFEAMLGLLGLLTRPETLVRPRAELDLVCPAREIAIECLGGFVSHNSDHIRCEARGCGRVARYRCEALLLEGGPVSSRGAATCE